MRGFRAILQEKKGKKGKKGNKGPLAPPLSLPKSGYIEPSTPPKLLSTQHHGQ